MLKKIIFFIEGIKYYLKNFVINSRLKNELYSNLSKKKNDKFYIYLDLMSFRATWDIITFLINAKIRCGETQPVLIIIPEQEVDYNLNPPKEKSWLKNISKKIRIDNIVKTSIEIIEDFNPQVVYLNNRKDLTDHFSNKNAFFPSNSDIGKIIEWNNHEKEIINYYNKNKIIACLTAPSHYSELINIFINENNINKKIVTITLRQSSFNESKNSTIKNWERFYFYLLEKNYFPIILDDFENYSINHFSNDKFYKYYFANSDIRVRLALYEKSFLNLGVISGPMALNIYSKKSNFIIFKHLDLNPKSSSSHEANLNLSGLDSTKNEQYPFHSLTQKIVWNPYDDFEILKNEFNKMEKLLQ